MTLGFILALFSLTNSANSASTAPALLSIPSPSTVRLQASDADSIRKELQSKLEELRKKDAFPGATAAAVLSDGTIVTTSIGVSDLESHTPMKPSDRMLAGSIGKTYFAAILMNLLHDHKFALDDKIEKYIGAEPWFNRLPNARQITIHMLMNHTSGIPEHVESPEFTAAVLKGPDKIWSPVELLSFVFDKPALFPAGTKWSYADTNYILLAYVAEKITGKRMYDLIEKDILKPLSLKDTSPSTSRTLPGLITGYSMPGGPFVFEGRTIHDGKFVVNPQFEWAGGGFVSTSADLARWAQDLYECKAFPPEMLPIMLQSLPAWTGPGDKYGLGVQIRQTEFGETYGHGGWFPGYLSEMEYFPQFHVAIAVQVNTDHFDQPAGKTHSYIVALAKQIFPAKSASPVAVN